MTKDAAKPAELEEKIVIGEDVQPSDDVYDTSSTEAEIDRPPFVGRKIHRITVYVQSSKGPAPSVKHFFSQLRQPRNTCFSVRIVGHRSSAPVSLQSDHKHQKYNGRNQQTATRRKVDTTIRNTLWRTERVHSVCTEEHRVLKLTSRD